MAKRQYFTKDGMIEKEPTQQELNDEYDRMISSPIYRALINTLEKTVSTKGEISTKLKEEYLSEAVKVSGN
jgi:hypothetical protein